MPPYGQQICASIKDNNKYFKGTLNNKIPITMFFEDKETVGGFYYYESKGQYILLNGKKTGNTIELSNDSATETFKGILNGNELSGNWINLKTKVTMPFSVKQ